MKLNKIMLALVGSIAIGVSTFAAPSLAHDRSESAAGQPLQSSSMGGQPSPHSSMGAVNGNAALRAAAEPFENLTEMAFSSSWANIDQTIRTAEAGATGARGSLSPDATSKLDTHLVAMKSARQRQDRADLALSSIEVYRVLVSSVTDSARIPTEVSLLDYAGFRYDADLQASPVRWDDMKQAVDFAHKQWAVIAPRLKRVPVAKRFEKAVEGMDRAAQQQNHSLAAASVKSESDLVDELEKYFRTH